MGRKRTIVASVATAIFVCLIAVAFFLMRADDETGKATDCQTVDELFAEWNDTVGAAERKLTDSGSGREDTLALAAAEADMASKIRKSGEGVQSPDIAELLDEWATGADQIAQGREEQINDPDRDVTAPAPRGYVEGSIAAQTATSNLVTHCPAARQADTDS
ncbi:MAG: hypothetical protein K0R68_3660 [Mycobacterium sp.]|jgi:hypothetical protein|nr:hypothetical protein [Mycobacterium sp.]